MLQVFKILNRYKDIDFSRLLCVCVGDVMDVVFSVCIVRRGAVGARVWGV